MADNIINGLFRLDENNVIHWVTSDELVITQDASGITSRLKFVLGTMANLTTSQKGSLVAALNGLQSAVDTLSLDLASTGTDIGAIQTDMTALQSAITALTSELTAHKGNLDADLIHVTAAEKAKIAAMDTSFKGLYSTVAALEAAHPTGQEGWWALVSGAGHYNWNETDQKWEHSDAPAIDMSLYYTKIEADALFATLTNLNALASTVGGIQTDITVIAGRLDGHDTDITDLQGRISSLEADGGLKYDDLGPSSYN